MPIYKIKNDKLVSIKEKKILLEKDIQKLTEDNLDIIFGLKFISTEFAVQNFRIDTLAYDETSNSFIIPRYPKGAIMCFSIFLRRKTFIPRQRLTW